MMTKQSNRIVNPDIEQLGHLKAMSDAAMAHKYFQENSKVIEKLSEAIKGAYALNADEIKERDEAVKTISNAKAESKKADDDKKEALAVAEKAKKDADTYSKNTRDSADNYKKEAMASVSKEQQKVIDDKADIKKREDDLSEALKQLCIAQQTVKDGMKEIADWKIEKESWEQDYTDRSEKLDAKLRKAVKG